MLLLIIYFLLGAVSSFLTFLPFNLFSEWWVYLLMFLLAAIYAALCLGLTMLIIRFTGLFMDKSKKQIKANTIYYNLMYEMVKIASLVANIKINYINLHKLPKEKYMFIFNHTSNWDGMIFLNYFKRKKICFVEKKESFSNTVLGDIVYKSGFIPLDRKSPQSAVDTIYRAVDKLTNQNTYLGIAPEGTRSKNGKLLPFNSGAFKIATLSKKPLVLFGLKNVNLIKDNAPFKRTNITMEVIEIIYPEFFINKSEEEICKYCEDKYKKYLNQ